MENLLQLMDQPNNTMLQQVGWVRLAKEISSHAHFEINATELQHAPSYKDKKLIEEDYRTLLLYQGIIDSGEFQKYSAEQKKLISTLDFFELLKVFYKKEVHGLKELNYYLLSYEVAHQTPQRIKDTFPKWTSLAEFEKKLQKELLKEFRSFVDFTGEADFSRHPIIGPLIKQLSDHEKRTNDVIMEQVRKLSEENKLQFAGYDIIHGRYVVPYKTDKYSSNLGNIIHRSDSGSTLYIELRSFEEFSLKRTHLKEAIEYEIFNLEKRYTKTLQDCGEVITYSLEVTKKNDKYFAKALWSIDFNGCIPDITSECKMYLSDFYHPSIKDAVKNKMSLTEKESVLLISGPNTGGKSIILKALCINYLLMYSGLPIAASSASLYPYSEIYYLASDGQDLNQGLSSFAAESLKIINILEHIEQKAFLLVDEIFSSTSSEEASIIAYSVMSYWQKQKLGHAIFTSHHQTLKSLAHENGQIVSAHVGFNDATGVPTYVLHLGVPGSSHAIQIFEKFLQKSKIKNDLLNEISEKKDLNVDYEKLIKNLQKRELEIQKEYAQEKLEIQKIKSSLNAEVLDFETKKNAELSKFKEQLSHLKKRAEGVIATASVSPRKNISNVVENEFWQINKEANQVANIEKKQQLDVDHKTEKLQRAQNITVGKTYYSSQWKRTVEVLSYSESTMIAEVMMGNIKTRVKSQELFDTKEGTKKKFISSIDRQGVPSTTLDARGMRLEDFEDVVESHLSFVISGDIPFLEIIHGHGDGILKNWLWLYLKNQAKLLKYEIPDLSYGGVTKVYLV
jgi:DNA mismatch repair protein MutS2